jgi:RHS repeat-associated protein
VARTDASGTVISTTRYEPYGYFASGLQPTIGFTGHVNDVDTGLTYMQQRYYDPVAGRFLSIDPVMTDANTGSSFNRYVYGNNSPYKYTDPDGRFSEAQCKDMGGNCITLGEIASSIKDGFEASVAVPVQNAVGAVTDWLSEKLEDFRDQRQARFDMWSAAYYGDARAQQQIGTDVAAGFAGSISSKIAGRHAFEKHVLGVGAMRSDSLFRGLEIRTVAQLEAHVAQVMGHPTAQKALSRGRTAYWDANTSTVIIHNPRASDLGTVFQPANAKAYFDNLR